MSSPPRNTLFVAGFPPAMRARDLGYEFERCGKIVRCDIPALRSSSSTPYAFIEFEDARDAEEAHQKLHGMRFGSYTVTVQFAKKVPHHAWKGSTGDGSRGSGGRSDWGRGGDRRDDRGAGRDRRDDRDRGRHSRDERDKERERDQNDRSSRDDRDRSQYHRRRSLSPG